MRALAEPGKTYAVYVKGGLRRERYYRWTCRAYEAEWVNTKTGVVDKTEELNHNGGNSDAGFTGL